MAWTYTTLKQAIQDYVESTETTFVSQIPNIVAQAEERILHSVQLPDFRKVNSGSLTASNRFFSTPSDMIAPYSFAVNNSGYVYLLPKEVNFIREAYPSATTEGVPAYYAIYDDTQFIVAPTPDSNYSIELQYFYKPETIVTAGSSWLGTHAESALLYGCLLEAYTFLKGDPDLMQTYAQRYEDALQKLAIVSVRNASDNYRGR
jgi:hypothetical protein